MYVVLECQSPVKCEYPTINSAIIKRNVVDIRLFDTDKKKRINEMYFTTAVCSATQHQTDHPPKVAKGKIVYVVFLRIESHDRLGHVMLLFPVQCER